MKTSTIYVCLDNEREYNKVFNARTVGEAIYLSGFDAEGRIIYLNDKEITDTNVSVENGNVIEISVKF